MPQIMHYSKQALSQFEAQARKGGELPQNGNFRERDRDRKFCGGRSVLLSFWGICHPDMTYTVDWVLKANYLSWGIGVSDYDSEGVSDYVGFLVDVCSF